MFWFEYLIVRIYCLFKTIKVCKRRLKMDSKFNWGDVHSDVAVFLPINSHRGWGVGRVFG